MAVGDLRTVVNLTDVVWTPINQPGLPDDKVYWHVISYDEKTGQGSYYYKMDPGARSNSHRHNGPEEWFMIEGDLTDHDGYEYRKGDFVSLDGGSSHHSYTKNGCIVIVTHRGVVDNISDQDLG